MSEGLCFWLGNHPNHPVLSIPRGQLLESHSGTYTCTRTNEHGQATTAIRVTVKPDQFETVLIVSYMNFC